MIELAILGLLADQDLHGYELKKQLAELLGPWSSVSFGSLYPALGRLEKAGHIRAIDAAAVEAGDDEAPTIPMTGALSGELAAFRSRRTTAKAGRAARPKAALGRRGKKVYAITAAGRERAHELLTAPGPDDERSFSLRVAFCQQLTPQERLALFERRRAELTTMLDTRRVTAAPSSRRADPYRRLLRDRDTRSLTSDLAWIDELVAATAGALAAEEAAPAAGPDPSPASPTRADLELSAPTIPRPPFAGSVADPSPKAGTP